MTPSAVPTATNRGLLSIGTKLEGFGTIRRVSLTAYEVEWDGCQSAWVSFDQIHGRPEPVMPLVVLR